MIYYIFPYQHFLKYKLLTILLNRKSIICLMSYLTLSFYIITIIKYTLVKMISVILKHLFSYSNYFGIIISSLAFFRGWDLVFCLSSLFSIPGLALRILFLFALFVLRRLIILLRYLQNAL